MTKRPAFWLWLKYAFGGGLPAEYNEWVLHDTTCSTWLLRHFGRVLTVLGPPLAVLPFLIPANTSIRVLTTLTVGLCQLLLFAIIGSDMTERRLTRAGYTWGTGETTRAQRVIDAQRTANRERRERVAARRSSRL
jgi:hypothetical protein